MSPVPPPSAEDCAARFDPLKVGDRVCSELLPVLTGTVQSIVGRGIFVEWDGCAITRHGSFGRHDLRKLP